MIRVMRTGKNPTMKTLGRTHRISVAWLHERFARGDFELAYEKSDQQAADAMTKAFSDVSKWEQVCALMNHVHPDKLWRPRRREDEGIRAAGGLQQTAESSVPSAPHRRASANNHDSQQQPEKPRHTALAQAVKVGDKFNFSAEAAREMARALEAIEWPQQSRKVIEGRGTCVGATYDPSGPRLVNTP